MPRPRELVSPRKGDVSALRTTTKGGEMRYSLRQRIVLPAVTVPALLVTMLLFAHTADGGRAAPPQPNFGSGAKANRRCGSSGAMGDRRDQQRDESRQ